MQNSKQLTTTSPSSKRRGQNLAQQVFETIRQQIVTGKVPPNQRLIELEIAGDLGTSRTTVREALKRLEVKGYVTTLPSGGVAVTGCSAEHIQSLFEVREALETMSIKLACQRATEEQIHKATEYYNRFVDAIRNRDFDQYVELHRAFHEELNVACGNEPLWSLAQTFRHQYFDYRLARVYTASEWRTQIVQHGQILKALRKRCASHAEKAVQEHLRAGLKVALERLV